MLQLEHDLAESSSLDSIDHEFIVRAGLVWEELQSIILQNRIELLASGRTVAAVLKRCFWDRSQKKFFAIPTARSSRLDQNRIHLISTGQVHNFSLQQISLRVLYTPYPMPFHLPIV